MRRRIMLGVIVAALALGNAGALAQGVETIEAAFKEWQDKHRVQKATLAVTHNGRLVLSRGYGGTAADAPVLLASLSKAVTGSCIGALVDAGKLTFDARVGEVLGPFFKRKGEPADPRLKNVTVAQLLTHRSGYDDKPVDPVLNTALRQYLTAGHPGDTAIEPLTALALKSKLPHEPGTAYAYSNMNYLLLGLIVEQVAGEPYERHCRGAVLTPLGLEAVGPDSNWRLIAPFGGWRMSGPQYLRFLEVFAPDSRVLGPKARAFLLDGEGKWHSDKKETWYGLGVNERRAGGGLNLWHAGALTFDFTNSINGIIRVNTGTYAVRLANGTSWFAHYQPRPAEGGVTELDRVIGRAVAAVKNWSAD